MLEPHLSTPSGLYPGIIGAAWHQLDDTVRHFHDANAIVHAAGVFQIRRGNNGLARLLARLARLPPAGETVPVLLVVTPRSDEEQWRRTFAGRPLLSRQYQRGNRLVERMGAIELRFRLQVVHGVLSYIMTSAALCVGPVRLPFLPGCGPRVTAREAADGQRLSVWVEVTLPLLGILLSYQGTLRRIDSGVAEGLS